MNAPLVTDGAGALLPWARSLWVYAGVLFADALSLPVGSTLYVAAMGTVHSPLVVALVGASATTAGSLAQYGIVRWIMRAGVTRRGAVARVRARIEHAVAHARDATAAALFVVYATPLSAGPLRLIAAVSGFSLWRFTAAIWLGCLPYYFVLATLGRAIHFPWWMLAAGIGIVLGLGIVHAVQMWRAASPEGGAARDD